MNRNEEEEALVSEGHGLPPVFFASANKFPYSNRSSATPPASLYFQNIGKYFNQEEIANYLQDPNHVSIMLNLHYFNIYEILLIINSFIY